MILVIFDNHNLRIWCFEESVCRNKMRKSRRRWKEGPQFQIKYDGFYRRFNFNFRFEFEYRIHCTIKGDAFEWILGYLNASFEMTFLRENTHKNLHSTSFCTRSDDPALGRMIRPNSAQTFGVSPDDPDLVTCERPELPRSDDPVLYRMIRTWEFQCVFSSFCQYPGWSEGTPDDPGTTRKHTTVIFGGGSIYTPSPPFFNSLSLFPTNLDSKALNPPLLSILELDSCKETPRDWEEVRFEVWFESTPWASTCSSQESLEATFDLSIRVCYSWRLAPKRLEVPVSFHSFVVEPRKFVLPRPSWTFASEKLNPPTWLIEWGKGL